MRAIAALSGILIAAMMAGCNSRVSALALADIRGALGVGIDAASWLGTAATAGELVAMPFAAWFAVTLSIRRFQLWMLGISVCIAVILPFIHALNVMIMLRFIQGMSCGALIPVLMMAALKFLPPSVRLHGLALFALTATFAPNVSIWLAGYWTDGGVSLNWVYWQIIPLSLLAAALIAWGLPHEEIKTERYRTANWGGMVCAIPALCLLTLVLTQGVRLDWFRSPLIEVSLVMGMVLLFVYFLTEWYHPSPFIKLQTLGRHNLLLGNLIFILLLIALLSGGLLPALYLGSVHNYRSLQTASTGLIIALPQLFLGSVVAIFLFRKWVDARIVFALGLALIALSCWFGSQLTPDWNKDQFTLVQSLQAIGQPMAIVPMLFLMTSVVQPGDGPYVSGTINLLRVQGTLIGGALIGQLIAVRSRFHAEILLDGAAGNPRVLSQLTEPSQLMALINQQSLVLSVADAYRVLGTIAFILVPLALMMQYIPAPDLSATQKSVSQPQG